MAHSMWDQYKEISLQLDAIQQLMQHSIRVQNQDISSKINEYIAASGKMLRPALIVLFGSLRETPKEEQLHYAAAATELFHIATLLHDDVIDGAEQRRGVEAFQKSTSNRIAVYAGDYLITLSVMLFNQAEYEIAGFVERANSMHQVLTGELFQYANLYRYDMTLRDYLKQIKGKTAKLFAMSAFLGRYESGKVNEKQARQAFLVGEEFGMAFQMVDDLLDYMVDEKYTGKPRMQDVKNGIYTAPLLYALQKDRTRIEAILRSNEDWSTQREQELYDAIEELGGFEKARQLAMQYHQRALARLTKMKGSKATIQLLEDVFDSVLRRDF